LELASGGTRVFLFSQCNMVWRSFVQAGGTEWEALIPLGAFFCQVAPASQQNFWFTQLTLSASAF
jgi:hypothetical protein